MITKTFWYQDSIEPYWQKHFDAETTYAIIDVRPFLGWWKMWTVVFYRQKDVVDLLQKVVFDVVQNELVIPVKTCVVSFDDWSKHQAHIDLATDNDKLLVGKFNQNQQSLELFLSLFLSNRFRTKYEVKLKVRPLYKHQTKKNFVTTNTPNKNHL